MDSEREQTTLQLMSLWFADDVTDAGASAFASLAGIARTDLELAKSVISHDWLADGLTADESDALTMLLDIVRADLGLAKSAADRPWFVDGGVADNWSSLAVLHGVASEDLALAIRLMKYPWLIDDGPSDQWRTLGFLLGIVRPDSKLLGEAIGSPLSTDGATPRQRDGLAGMRTIAQLDLGLAGQIVGRPWFAEGESADQWDHIWTLHDLAKLDIELARAVVDLPWLIDGGTPHQEQVFSIVLSTGRTDLELAKRVVKYAWFIDGVSEDELQIFFSLRFIAREDVELGRLVTSYPWINDDLTHRERQALVMLRAFAETDLEVARSKANAPWFIDGVTDVEFVRFALSLSDAADDLTTSVGEDLRNYFFDSLTILARYLPDHLQLLAAQPWLADGLDNEEAAFAIAINELAYQNQTLYEELLNIHYTQSNTISLPLAGDVNIWVFSNDTFTQNEDLMATIEDTVRIAEDFLGLPFPTSDIILLAIAHPEKYNGVGQFHGGSHMQLFRYNIGSIPHETAHYYFTRRSGHTPRWFAEGGADFMSDLVYHRTGVEEISRSRENAARGAWDCMGRYEFENIRHLEFVQENYWWQWNIHEPYGCFYSMGRSLLHGIFETIGEEAISSALEELFLGLENSQRDFEEDFYHAFLNNTPMDRKNDFLDLYRTLHGGSYAYPDIVTSDDHGDVAQDATVIIVGNVVWGTLDHMFDFDYFRFKAEEGRKYQMNVTHETLRTGSVGLYGPDGVIGQNRNWKSRELVPSGPQIVWIAPRSDEYYFAVQNFGDKAGPYTLAITPVEGAGKDDHGDTEATATEITPGQAIEGVIDDDLDIDYFRFSVVQGQEYRMDVMAGTLEDFRYRISMPDGHFSLTPPRWTYGLYWNPGNSGEAYLAVDAVNGKVGTYTLKVTPADNEPGD